MNQRLKGEGKLMVFYLSWYSAFTGGVQTLMGGCSQRFIAEQGIKTPSTSAQGVLLVHSDMEMAFRNAMLILHHTLVYARRFSIMLCAFFSYQLAKSNFTESMVSNRQDPNPKLESLSSMPLYALEISTTLL